MRIFLSGPMGSGKTTVGKALAARLHRPFVDLDEAICADAGSTINAIFDVEGERGFRERERRAALAMLRATQEDAVVALGGGTVVDAGIRRLLLDSGVLVTLTGRPETLAARLEGDTSRPLLAVGEDRAATLAALLGSRSRAYAMAHATVDTSELPLAEVVAHVERVAEDPPMLVIMGDAVTRVHIRRGAAVALDSFVAGTRDVVLVTDDVVAAAWSDAVASGLPLARGMIRLSSGDSAKSFASYESLLVELGALGVGRDGCLVALGGGAVGDVVGFAAATYQRGIRWINVPTTLLAMLDSCIGGKTGVDTPRGKNQVGAFHPATEVVVDVALLNTLSAEHRRHALSELIKVAMLSGEEAISFVESSCDAILRGDLDTVEAAVRMALRAKSEIVTLDPWEDGARRLLNLGHTFGHALETAAAGRMPHGEAVAHGLRGALAFGRSIGKTEQDFADRVLQLLERAGLGAQSLGEQWTSASRYLLADKKRRGDVVSFVLPVRAGDVRILPVKVHDLVEFASNLAVGGAGR